MYFLKSIETTKHVKHLLGTMNLIARYTAAISKPKVFVAMKDVPKSAIDLLHERFDVEISDFILATHEEVLEKIKDKFGIFCNRTIKINEDVIKAAGPSLKVVSTMSVGYEHIDLVAMKKYGLRLGYTADILTETVAETTIGLLISTTRRFFEANRALKTTG